MANLEHSVVGEATTLVAKAIGHASTARDKGITDAYKGHLKHDTWQKRLDEHDRTEDFGIAIGDQPFKKRRMTSEKIDSYIEANGLLKDKRGDRVKARMALTEQQKRGWVDQQHGVRDTVSNYSPTTRPSKFILLILCFQLLMVPFI